MPSTSKKQHNFMAAIANSPSFAKKVGVSQSVGKDFNAADKGKTFNRGGMMKKRRFDEGGDVSDYEIDPDSRRAHGLYDAAPKKAAFKKAKDKYEGSPPQNARELAAYAKMKTDESDYQANADRIATSEAVEDKARKDFANNERAYKTNSRQAATAAADSSFFGNLKKLVSQTRAGGSQREIDKLNVAAVKSKQMARGGMMKESKAMVGKEMRFMKKKGAPASMIKHEKSEMGMAKGGMSYAKGGGIESRGKTKGTMVRMASGGSVSSASRRADGIAQRGKTRC